MPTVMVLVEHATGGELPAGQYLSSYDADAVGDRGIKMTTREADAMRFRTLEDALQCWKRQSRTRPWRPDGRPNRPLTAYTVTFKKVD